MAELITRASEAMADLLCPGRAQAQHGLPESPPGPYADYGRAIHHALAVNDPSALTHEQRDVYDGCQKIVADALFRFFGENAAAALGNAIVEKEFSIHYAPFNHIGHPDVIYRWETRLLIPDFKTLPGDVSGASTNLQLRDYAVMADLELPLISEIGTVIIQPMVTHTPEIAVYNKADLHCAWMDLLARVRNSHDPEAPRIAGDIQCQWCRAKSLCREYQAWASQKVPVHRSLMNTPVALWSPGQRAIFCASRKSAQKWLDHCEAEMKAFLKADPQSIPGFHLEDGDEIESLTDVETIYQRFIALGGTHAAFMECLKGVKIKGKLEAKVSEATGARGKALDSIMKSLTAGASEKKQNQPSIAKDK